MARPELRHRVRRRWHTVSSQPNCRAFYVKQAQGRALEHWLIHVLFSYTVLQCEPLAMTHHRWDLAAGFAGVKVDNVYRPNRRAQFILLCLSPQSYTGYRAILQCRNL